MPPLPPFPNHVLPGKERDSETGLDYFGARYYGSNMGRFSSADPIFMNVMRVMDPQRLNLYTYGRNNPLVYTDPTGKDIVGGSGDQKAVRSALIEIAKHPGGRQFLTKLDKLTQTITVSTGTGIAGPDGKPNPGHTAPAQGASPQFARTRDTNGNITDVKAPNLDVTIDPKLAKGMRSAGDPNAPASDAELLGHELKHVEHKDFQQPDSETLATQGIDDILNNKPTKESKQGAEEFVDNLLKPNSQNNQQQQPPPPPPCTAEKDKPCPK